MHLEVKTKDGVERQGYIDAIMRLLKDADPETLRLVWIAARTLTRKGGDKND